MFRRWFSGFWARNKGKIFLLGKGAVLLILIAVCATVIMSSLSLLSGEKENENTIYKPRTTVIKGNSITKEEYQEDSGIIEKFIELCNTKQDTSAYNMLSRDCKEKCYPTLKDFKEKYLNMVFENKRTYNLQSWIEKGNVFTYKIRILDDLLSTGSYTDSVKYEDYITVDNDTNKVSINGLIKREQINKVTQTNEFYVEVVEKVSYVNYEEYVIKIRNLTNKSVILDCLDTAKDTALVGENSVRYYIEDIKELDLLRTRLNPMVLRSLNLKFKKNYSTDVKGEYIEFSNIIKDMDKYQNVNSEDLKMKLQINL